MDTSGQVYFGDDVPEEDQKRLLEAELKLLQDALAELREKEADEALAWQQLEEKDG